MTEQQNQDTTQMLRTEIRTLEGRLRNRDPSLLAGLEEQHKQLLERFLKLEKALHALLEQAALAQEPDDMQKQTETLKGPAAEYCKTAQINAELWKNIAS